MIGALAEVLRPLRRLRLRTKLTLVALGVTLASSLTFAITSYLTEWAGERDQVLARLDGNAEYSVERLTEVLDLLEADVFALTRTPEVAEILAATPSSLPAAAKARLERTFTDLMTVRKAYGQIRLIGRAGNWTELARVNATADGFRAVPDDMLQSKGDEPYLADIDSMRPGETYYHDVTRNREWGQIAGPPMLRLVRPIFDESGVAIAAMVINVEFERLLHWGLPHVPLDTRIVVVSSNLDYMIFDRPGATPRLMSHDSEGWTPPPHLDLYSFGPDASVDGPSSKMRGDVAVSMLSLDSWRDQSSINPFFASNHSQAIGPTGAAVRAHLPFDILLLVEMPRDRVFAFTRNLLSRDIATAATLALVTTFLALALGAKVLSPLTRLTDAIRTHSDRRVPIVFEATTEDEVGELATELTALSNELIRETKRLDSILTTAADAIVTIDEAGVIVDVNRATETLFGYAKDELVGQPITKLMFDADASGHQAFVDAAEEAAGPHRMARDRALEGRRKDGSPVAIEISVSCAQIDGHRHFTGIIRNVSERREAQERQAALLAELERSNSELDQFAYIASHDLKAPLRVIDNASRWLEEDLGRHFDDDTRESMDLLRSRVARMERLLDDLLQHSRIGRVALPSTLVTGDELIAEIRGLVGDPGSFTLEEDPALTSIVVQRMPLQTVLLNLINNAIKHHDKDHATVRVGVEDTGKTLVLTIEDDGPGIPPQYHAKVFELFQTLQPRDRVDSSGIGLAMVRKHVDVVGGQIELISDGSRGTTFRLHWPKPNSETTERAA